MEYNDSKQESLHPLAYAIELTERNIEEPSYHNRGFECIQNELMNNCHVSNPAIGLDDSNGACSSQAVDQGLESLPYATLSDISIPFVSSSYGDYQSVASYVPHYTTVSQPYIPSVTPTHILPHDKTSNYSPGFSHPESWNVSTRTSPLSSPPLSVSASNSEHTVSSSINFEFNAHSRSTPHNSSDNNSLQSPSDALVSPFSSTNITFGSDCHTPSPTRLPPLSPWNHKQGVSSSSTVNDFNMSYIQSQICLPVNGQRDNCTTEKRGKKGRPRGSRNKSNLSKILNPTVFPVEAAYSRKKRGRGSRARGANPSVRARVRSPVRYSNSDYVSRATPLYKRGSSTRGRGAMRMCRTCTNCLRTDDCAECVFCKDKSKFGGTNKLKQKCLKKQCVLKGKFIEHENPADATSRYIVQKKIPLDPPPLSHPPLTALSPFPTSPLAKHMPQSPLSDTHQLSPLSDQHKHSPLTDHCLPSSLHDQGPLQGPSDVGSLTSQEYLQDIPFKVWMQLEVSKDLNPSYDYT